MNLRQTKNRIILDMLKDVMVDDYNDVDDMKPIVFLPDDEMIKFSLKELIHSHASTIVFMYRVQKAFNLPPIPYRFKSRNKFFGMLVVDLLQYIDPYNPIFPSKEQITDNVSFITKTFSRRVLTESFGNIYIDTIKTAQESNIIYVAGK